MSIVNKSNIAIIPARGGSKGIKRKNLTEVKGIPLIAWTIESAKEAKLVDRVFVSTDDPEIRDVSLQYGAEVPFLRPSSLAEDASDLRDVLQHIRKELANRNIDFAAQVVLYPTSPFRTPDLIDRSIELALKYRSSVSSLAELTLNTNQLFARDEHQCSAVDFQPLAPIVKRMGIVIASLNNQESQDLPFSTSFLSIVEKLRETDSLNYDDAFTFLDKAYSEHSVSEPLPPIHQLVPRTSIIIRDSSTLLDLDTPDDLAEANEKSLSELPWLPRSLATEMKRKDESPTPQTKQNSTPQEVMYLYGQNNSDGLSSIGVLNLDRLSSPADVRRAINDMIPNKDNSVWISRSPEAPGRKPVVHSEPVVLLEDEVSISANCFFTYSEVAQARLLLREDSNPIHWSSGSLTLTCDKNGQLLDLSHEFTERDSLLVTIHTLSPMQLLEISRFELSDEGHWRHSSFKPFGDKEESVLSLQENCLNLLSTKLEGPLQVFVSWQRPADPERNDLIVCSPLELPGFTQYDYAKGRWVNTITGNVISGRQEEPNIHPWGGWAFLPRGTCGTTKWKAVTEREFFEAE